MQELMLHVLDVAMNAVSAGARTVKISLCEDPEADRFTIVVADDGPGMSADMIDRVLREFATTTTETKQAGWVGFGLALFRGTVETCDGSFRLLSRPGVGTLVEAVMPYGHPDRPPLGNVAESLQALLLGCVSINWCLTHRISRHQYRLDTRPVRRIVGAAYDTRAVREWLLERIREGEAALAVGRQTR
ncbi:MAG: sensor histidine kinase [Armatimonadetes bacterium]|nr:sensor histidine kinase [Armatimonadota bacterium]